MSGPWAIPFHERAGLTEGALLKGGAALSWGTRYEGWGRAGRTWLQCHHQPFEAIGGVGLQHVLTRLGLPLQPLLLPAAAAAAGRFAHPSPDPKSPLSRVEYGYRFDPADLTAAFAAARAAHAVEVIDSAELTVSTGEHGIDAVTLASGTVLRADLFVDAGGTDRRLSGVLAAGWDGGRRVVLRNERTDRQEGNGPCRRVAGRVDGWVSSTPLPGGALRTTLSAEGGPGDAPGVFATLGRAREAWTGNCVAVGHAAAVLDPLTAAPLSLLYRDAERLASLVPLGSEQSVERREYNRLFADDAAHAALFTSAFYAGVDHEPTAFWQEAAMSPPEALTRKLAQFESRGVLVAYDLEPFNAEDWLILHEGIGRTPRRYDRLADALPDAKVRQDLDARRAAIAQLAQTMPPADRYRARYLDYLEQNP